MTTETKEIWKPVAGYEGIYDVSNLGRVKTVERTCYLNIKGTDTQRIIKEKIKHPSQDGQGYKNNNGYLSVILSFKNKSKRFHVHRLVAEAFLENPNNYETVNHIDGNKFNNEVSNLEWASRKQNIEHAWKTGLNHIPSNYAGTHKKKITQKDLQGNIIKEWDSMTEAARFLGLDKATFSNRIKSGKLEYHGFLWIPHKY